MTNELRIPDWSFNIDGYSISLIRTRFFIKKRFEIVGVN